MLSGIVERPFIGSHRRRVKFVESQSSRDMCSFKISISKRTVDGMTSMNVKIQTIYTRNESSEHLLDIIFEQPNNGSIKDGIV